MRRFYEDFPATSLLILLIVGFFILEILAISKLVEPESLPRGFPLFFGGAGTQAIHPLGILDTDAVVSRHEYWRLLTAVVLHGGVVHLLFNLWVLIDLGRFCEAHFSSTKYFTFFVLSGLGGSLARWGWSQASGDPAWSLGASGALLGLIGACLSYAVKERQVEMRQEFTRWIIQIGLLSVLLSNVVDHAAHIGGFIVGGALGLSVDRYTTSATAERWRLPAWIAGAALGTSLLFGLFNYFSLLARIAG
ncbi:MAG TPA: rhomboid family intramembrane serine protease [Planctomycetota bacterium]|nr:rhomboid family intramembrane serine protease [Planctomycetota bacterium]